MSELTNKLDWWIKNELNVIFRGKHGVGKTALITQAFDRNKLKWKYFSAATMDPWCDFVGIPVKEQDAKGGDYLRLVRPKGFDDVEALFFDELNRAPKKVRNAVMELIQFKSINGEKFPNLKFVWAAINPEDENETYDVEKLDPAQLDRFHIQVNVPYKPDRAYFVAMYTKEVADAAIDWWNRLDHKIKDEISPRRLDYALKIHKANGDIRDALTNKANIHELIKRLNSGSITDKLNALMKASTAETIAYLNDENNFRDALFVLQRDDKYVEHFVPLFPKEKLAVAMSYRGGKVKKYILSHFNQWPVFKVVAKEIIAAKTNKKLTKELTKILAEPKTSVKSQKISSTASWADRLAAWKADIVWHHQMPRHLRPSTYDRQDTISEMINNLPISMTGTEAARTLDLMEAFATRCTKRTFQKMRKEIKQVVDACMPVANIELYKTLKQRIIVAGLEGGAPGEITFRSPDVLQGKTLAIQASISADEAA